MALAAFGFYTYDIGNSTLAWKSTYYNDPLLIVSSIGLFSIFKNITLNSNIINKLAKSAFGIYLFQSSRFIGSKMYEWLQTYGMEFDNCIFFVIVTIAILTAITAIIIDQVRILILDSILPLCVKGYKLVNNLVTRH